MEEIKIMEASTKAVSPEDERIERVKAIATIVVTAAVNIANIYGYSVDADQAVSVVLTIISFIAIFWCWWKNQNITSRAVQTQFVLDSLKELDKVEAAKHGSKEKE